MVSMELTHESFGCVFTTLLMGPVEVTLEYSDKPRQVASKVTGHPCVDREDTVVVTAQMPVEERETVKVSRTCKLLYSMYVALYTERRKTELMQGLWDVFSGLVV